MYQADCSLNDAANPQGDILEDELVLVRILTRQPDSEVSLFFHHSHIKIESASSQYNSWCTERIHIHERGARKKVAADLNR